MKIIIGLGNPGEKYTGTRHNIGFEILDALKEQWHFPEFEMSKKFEAEFSKNKFGETDIILAKPQTFMNLSGHSVLAIINFYRISTNDILVIHDDFDINIGKYKIANNSSSAGHNGVQDIIEKLGTKNFKRVRIGIKPENETALMDASDFVLQRFDKNEMGKIENIKFSILEEIEKISK